MENRPLAVLIVTFATVYIIVKVVQGIRDNHEERQKHPITFWLKRLPIFCFLLWLMAVIFNTVIEMVFGK